MWQKAKTLFLSHSTVSRFMYSPKWRSFQRQRLFPSTCPPEIANALNESRANPPWSTILVTLWLEKGAPSMCLNFHQSTFALYGWQMMERWNRNNEEKISEGFHLTSVGCEGSFSFIVVDSCDPDDTPNVFGLKVRVHEVACVPIDEKRCFSLFRKATTSRQTQRQYHWGK